MGNLRSGVLLEMLALVHAQTASTTTEAVALGAELTGMAHLAEELSLVLRAVSGIKQFVAKT